MEDFHFLRPLWLLALLALPLLDRLLRSGALLANAWARVIEARLLPYLLADQAGTGASQAWWRWLPLAAFATATVALAGPAWRQLPQPVLRDQASLVILFDLSQSMNAADVAPSRLERARLKVIDLLERREDGQTALIAYAGLPFVVSPLTTDAATIVSLVPVLSPELMPAGGSRADRALELAADLIDGGGDGNGAILLVTDDAEPRDVAVAGALAARGIRTSVLAVGTPDGAPVRVSGGALLKDAEGRIVHSRLGEDTLRELASSGEGRYTRLTIDDDDLDRLVGAIMTSGSFEGEEEMSTDIWREEGPWLLLPLLPLAALAFRRGVLVILVGIVLLPLPPPAHAFEWASLWQRRDQRGVAALQEERYERAAELLDDAEWKSAAYYRDGRYTDSAELLEGRESTRALYNRATALARTGDYPGAIELYREVLERVPEHEDARHNLEVLLDELEQQQQQGQQGDEGEQGEQMSSQLMDSSGAQGESGQGMDQRGGQSQGAGSDRRDEQMAEQQQQAGQMSREEIEAEAERRAAEALPEAGEEGEDGEQRRRAQLAEAPDESQQEREAQAAVEQWLRRIPDDPGGLLRRKFLYELQLRRQQGETSEEDPW